MFMGLRLRRQHRCQAPQRVTTRRLFSCSAVGWCDVKTGMFRCDEMYSRYCICLLICFKKENRFIYTEILFAIFIYTYHMDLLSVKANINTHICLDSVKRQDRHLGKFDKTKLCSWASLKMWPLWPLDMGIELLSFSEVCLPKISTIICFMILTVSLASPKSFEQWWVAGNQSSFREPHFNIHPHANMMLAFPHQHKKREPIPMPTIYIQSTQQKSRDAGPAILHCATFVFDRLRKVRFLVKGLDRTSIVQELGTNMWLILMFSILSSSTLSPFLRHRSWLQTKACFGRMVDVNAEPCASTLMEKKNGASCVTWHFFNPTDIRTKLEPWHEGISYP